MGKLYATVVLLIALVACQANRTAHFARNSRLFASNLYRTVASGSNGNVVISPISVQTALGLAYLGADGTTASEMSAGLHFDVDQNVVAENHKALFDHHSRSGVVKIANKIFLANNFVVKQRFMELATGKFYSAAENIDTTNGARAASTINQWVEGATNNKIKNLVTAGDVQNSASLLINAVHFKADWVNEFEKVETQPKPFRTSESQSKTVQMMHQKGSFPYGEFDDFVAVQLPYKNTDISMLVILPKAISGLSQVEPRFTEQNTDIPRLLRQLERTYIKIGLPKFKIEYEAKLKPTLEKMGMRKMFSDDANFTKLTDQPIKIGNVIHKAIIEVDEKGTEAAAATVVGIMLLSGEIPPRKVVIVDHPFLYFLVDSNGHIFFMGRYVT